MAWHTLDDEIVLQKLNTSLKGLTEQEAGARLKQYGKNILVEKKKTPAIIKFLLQFSDLMIIILIIAAVIAGVLGEAADSIAILVIVVLNAIVGFVQEIRAEKAMEALNRMAAPTASVIREGEISVIPAEQLVLGDIVILEAGRIVPADLRLTESVVLKIEEATLTGESVPVEKLSEAIFSDDAPLGDRKNMAFRGTLVTYGRGAGVVIATGMQTELGKIAAMLQGEKEERTPLQKRMEGFGKNIAAAVLIICAIVFVTGLLRGEKPLLMFMTAVSLAVAAIPEALPAVITISLALAASRMVKKNALVRNLPAVETLGSVTYICSDKTGTLTINKMTVEKIFDSGNVLDANSKNDVPSEKLLLGMALSNDCAQAGEEVSGDPTEVALYTAAVRYGFVKDKLVADYPRVEELPFDSERKCMTTFHLSPKGHYISFTKGSIDTVLDGCTDIFPDMKGKKPEAREIKKVNDEMAGAGLRVIAFAYRLWERLPAEITPEKCESGMVFAGLAAMMDPPREEAAQAVKDAIGAGIVPVMITGDHPLTAATIAARLGIITGRREPVITGIQLNEMNDEEFGQKVRDIRVYARVAPEQKLRIVKALQSQGEFVAMTGDGVNDAPALKKANIGIAMGITGTDVSKEASHMILLDDNFATIVGAVREGRVIYDNVRKFIRYLVSSNSGEIWTLFLAPFFGLPIPLLPIHILWVNLATDSLPALALSMEKGEGNVMKRPPRNPKESVFANGLGAQCVWIGLLMAAVVIGIQAWAYKTGDAHWQTMVFTVLCLSQLFQVLALRSEKTSIFKQGIFSNMYVLGAVALMFALQMMTIYVPLFNKVFKTQPLTLRELALAIAASCVVFVAVEVDKWVRRVLKR